MNNVHFIGTLISCFAVFYYVFLISYYLIISKTTKILLKKKQYVNHLKFSSFFTSIISLTALLFLSQYLKMERLSIIMMWIILIYILICVTHLIPFKIYLINKKGMFVLSPQFNYENIMHSPFIKWHKMNIKEIINDGDYFYIHVHDKAFGFIKIPIHYQDYYKIESLHK